MNRESMREIMMKIQEETQAKIEEILDEDQLERYRELTERRRQMMQRRAGAQPQR